MWTILRRDAVVASPLPRASGWDRNRLRSFYWHLVTGRVSYKHGTVPWLDSCFREDIVKRSTREESWIDVTSVFRRWEAQLVFAFLNISTLAMVASIVGATTVGRDLDIVLTRIATKLLTRLDTISRRRLVKVEV